LIYDSIYFTDRHQKSKEIIEGEYRWGHLTNKKRYPDIELIPFNLESDTDSSLKMITTVEFPQKDEIERAENIVEQLKNLRRLANTTVDGVFEGFCPVCEHFQKFSTPISAKRHLQSRDHKAKVQELKTRLDLF
jgi:hypothetical protein